MSKHVEEGEVLFEGSIAEAGGVEMARRDR